MTHWSAWSWRFRPDELRVLSHDGPLAGASLADWPFPYDEIEPFYEKAEWDFGVSGSAYANPFGAPRKKDYPNPPHPERVSSRRVRARRARSSATIRSRCPVAINSRAVRRPPAVHVRRRLLRLRLPGAAPRRRRSRSAFPKALATGKLDLRAERRRARDHRREGRPRAAASATSTRPERSTRSAPSSIVVSRQLDRLVAPPADVEVGSFPHGPRQLERARREEPHVPHRAGGRLHDRRAGARHDRHQRPRRRRRPAPERSEARLHPRRCHRRAERTARRRRSFYWSLTGARRDRWRGAGARR